MAEKIRVGVVGCGKIATVSHVPDYVKQKDVQIAALCDILPEKAELMKKEQAPEAAIYTEFSEFLKADLDAISICTPNDLHYSMTMAALENGWNVLCEKPMASNLDEASEMIAKAEQKRRVLQINQSLRYTGLYGKVADLVHGGVIGEPTHLRCMRASTAPPNKNWSVGADWFVSKAHHGGIILDIAIHMADLLKWLAGDVDSISAYNSTQTPGIDVVDNVNAMLKFNNGAIGVLELTWTSAVGGGLLEIYGTKGRIRIGFGEEPIELTTVEDGEAKTECIQPESDVKSSYTAFIDAVRGIAPSRTPGELGRDALALCMAIQEAGETDQEVKVKKFS